MLLAVFTLANVMQQTVSAAPLSAEDQKLLNQGIYYFSSQEDQFCSASTTTAPVANGQTSNLDYSGKEIFNAAQLAKIEENRSAYEAAASEAGIPWPMIAVIHYRETRLGRSNPGNGQGIYQFLNKNGGPYPTGEVSDAEFLRQTKLAANFIKTKTGAGDLSSGAAEAVKDAFFGYNGRAGVYKQQAVRLGFTEAQGYEGSPYVMNRADAQRDPGVNKTTWGQIKTDGGGISYPANGDYGSYVMYASLAGQSFTSSCKKSDSIAVTGPVRAKILQLLQQELQSWSSGAIKPGEYTKYSAGVRANWCAFFASWIFNQAGYPIDPNAPEGRVGPVAGVMSIGKAGGRFTWHDAAGYTPAPGDLAVYKSAGQSHVNIVTEVSGGKITVIGGNQGNGGYETTKVTQYSITNTTTGLTGFVSPSTE